VLGDLDLEVGLLAAPVFVVGDHEDAQEGVGEVLVELRAAAVAQDRHRLLGRHALTVRAIGRHRRIGVGHADHAADCGNRIAGELLRVALAVDSLVVVAHERRDVAVEIHLAEDLRAHRRM
jgi:hypothetical protein